MIVLMLAALPVLAQAGERVELWHCPGDVYTDRACDGGRLLSIDRDANLVAAETRRPARIVADASGPSVLMIPRPAPHVFEPPSVPHPPLIFGPPTINVRVVR
ncbi:MAG TPA: hypothetical protein VGE10_05345 [Zeimonas sp.]